MARKNQPDDKTGGTKSHLYNLRQALARFERGYIGNILELTRWNRTKTAQMLGIEESTLKMKIREYHLSPANQASPRSEDEKI